ncbi:hypothetical protein IID19_00200 [Patescibacteria group bacterium]|nr:hypothetical protein [Patescibacteria group bacterium]
MKKSVLIIGILFLGLLVTGATSCNIKSKSTASDGGVYQSTDFGENWKQIITIAKAEKEGQNIGNIDTRFITFDSANENLMYLNTTGNGIFASTNKGTTWRQTSLSTGTYASLSIDARNNNVIYTTQGSKILKTVDGMKSWHEIYTETRPGQKIVSVVVDPFQSNIIYAATTTSIIKSIDFGNTWKLLGWEKTQIISLHVSKINNQTLYARVNGGIYKSTNAAIDWTIVSEGLKEFRGGTSIHWFNFDPNTEIIFLGTGFGIIKSTDRAQTWVAIPTLFDFRKIPIKTVIYHPENLNKIIFSVNNVLHKTDDGGKTWKTLKTVRTTRTITYMVTDPSIDDLIFLGTTRPAK